jgi:Outer membrane protein beta-barrel domain
MIQHFITYHIKSVLVVLLILMGMATYGQSTAGNGTSKQGKTRKLHPGFRVGFDHLLFKDIRNYASAQGDGGFVAGVFLSPQVNKGFSYRTELLYDRQKIKAFHDGPELERLQASYLTIPHLVTYTIARFIQIQAGGTLSLLLQASKTNYDRQSVTDYYNRIKYGFAGGLEIHPFKGILLTGRYDFDLINSYKNQAQGYPFIVPTKGFSKGFFQLSAGYAF